MFPPACFHKPVILIRVPASVYKTEPYVGRALRECGLSRSEFFITTKWSGSTSIEQAIQNSLDSVSLMQSVMHALVHY